MDDFKRHNRIGEALDIRGMKQVELCEKAGVNKSALNNWINQRWQPKQEPLYKMAKALDVSEMWLAGYAVPMARDAKQKKLDDIAKVIKAVRDNERYYQLMDCVLRIDDEQLTIIETMLNQFIKR